MKLTYAFNLGRVFTLSLAELFAVFENMRLNFRLVELYREVLIIETETELDSLKLQKQLGGTIKIMSVFDSLGRKKTFGPSAVFWDYFDIKILKEKFLRSNPPGKVNIGISLYPLAQRLPLRGEAKRIGLRIKEIMTGSGISTRIVFPQLDALALPSVVVSNERILEKGAEMDFLIGEERIYLGKTLTVQDFEDYGRRDYQRPVRDGKIGMLPPKVAQIMLNLAQIPATARANPKNAILDPFAGSGTVLQEAILMGFRSIGSDVSEKSVESAEKNLLWAKNRYKLPPGRFEIIKSDVGNLETNLPKLKYEAIVTEGTLGPSYTETPTENAVRENFRGLEQIYLKAFKSFAKILPSGKRIVIALPAYRLKDGYHFFEMVDKIHKLGYDTVDPLPEVLPQTFGFLDVTKRKSIIYDRKDQFVSREIFIFKQHGA